jgi:hypothetical protein
MGHAIVRGATEKRVLLGACAAALVLPTIAVVSEQGAGLSMTVLICSVAVAAVLANLVTQQLWAGAVFAGAVCMSPVLFVGLFAAANGGSIDILVLIPVSFVAGSVLGAIVCAVIKPVRR